VAGGLIALVNSRDLAGPALIITRVQFSDFLAAARVGHFGHLIQPG
jgi:hypothetical protein